MEEEELNEFGYSSIINVIDMIDIIGDFVELSRGFVFLLVVKYMKMNRKVGKLKEIFLFNIIFEVFIDVEDWKYDEVKNKFGLRLEIFIWDYYDLLMEIVEILVDEKEESLIRGDVFVCFLMEIILGLM